ncbi:hypothetical protein E2C01_075728 [Portunus trituberculatus]|uniref:Uncharacterized protein n=1 Tax=Portunus trituberculatus TaxID=210409 RepID=A0A5B7IHU5_PORTR|nr:hypothetical protein [Portunus trituberculatus]
MPLRHHRHRHHQHLAHTFLSRVGRSPRHRRATSLPTLSFRDKINGGALQERAWHLHLTIPGI